MTSHQRIARVRRNYNQWVANQTLEDYALRFTAKNARKWSALRVANTAIGAISFLALEAIGGAITLNYGFTNTAIAILAVGSIIFMTGLPIAYYAARYGVDIDLLTRGAGFGYIGSTITSLIYASFTFIFFAIEAAIMSLALEMCFGIPLFAGYVISSLVVIPLVTHGITFISRFQLWTQPIWIALHLLPFIFIAARDLASFSDWTHFTGAAGAQGQSFNLLLFGSAATVVFSLVAQIGEQVDFLRFLPAKSAGRRHEWWGAYLIAGPGWIVPGMLKLLAGSFLAVLALKHFVSHDKAAEPTQMYLVAFQYVFSSPGLALGFTGAFVIISQIKINVTNAYAGSIAWSNFFSRLTHSHPGRVVWLVFNVAIALLLMELGIFKALEHILGLYSIVAVAWVGALVADLTVNKPLKLSPSFIEFKRAHLYDINPVGVGAMLIAAATAIAAYSGLFGEVLQALSSFVALIVAFVAAPAIAFATKGRFYIAREPHKTLQAEKSQRCCICEFVFEGEDMATCPAYAGPICSLCCTLDARCNDCCKTKARLSDQILGLLGAMLPKPVVARLNSRVGHYLGLMTIFSLGMGAILMLIYFQANLGSDAQRDIIRSTFSTVYFIFLIIAGVAAWLFVLAQESRRVAQEESQRQTALLMQTEANLQRAKEGAESANRAKSRYVVGISHELRTPLNAILGYAQLLEHDRAIPAHRRDAIRVVRHSAEHLSGLIDGLLDIARIEAGRFQLNRDEVRIGEFLDQIVGMFRLQASARNIAFQFNRPERLPVAVYTDEKQLRQILINLLSNAIKFTDTGFVALRVHYRGQVAEFEIEDTGIGIPTDEIERIFEPFVRGKPVRGRIATGTGLGLTITKLLTQIMGGDLAVDSRIGVGTVFRLKLLLSEVPNPRLVAPESRIRGYRGQRVTILIADDEPSHRNLMREALAPLGFTVFTAADGASCLELAAQCRPDLVLVDISMPDIDGWAVAAELRAITPVRPAIVMLSAYPEEKRTASDAPPVYDAYLMKPLILHQLLATLRTLLAIEWTDEAEDEPVISGAPLSRPAPDQIDALLRLGEIGHVRGIQAKLHEIETEQPEHQDFVEEMREMVRNFDLKRYMTALEAMRSDVYSKDKDIALVVDDSPATLSLLTDALDEAGITVLVAVEGPLALVMVDRVRPDIVLMDAMMPGMDGFETTRQLKRKPGMANVPVIFMTGLSEPEHIVSGFAAGCVDYVTKPIHPGELLARMRVHLVNARRAASAQAALDVSGRHLLAVNPAGDVLWSTPQAAKLLERTAFKADVEHPVMPAAVCAWLASVTRPGVASDGEPYFLRVGETVLPISYVGNIGPDEILLRLHQDQHQPDEVVLRQRLSLTPREAEVLTWLARGKSSRDIAEILKLSPRTVDKHLEQIYSKLGVENRAAAATLAVRTVGRL